MANDKEKKLKELKALLEQKIKEYDDDGDGVLESHELTDAEVEVILGIKEQIAALQPPKGPKYEHENEYKEGDTKETAETKSKTKVTVSAEGVGIEHEEGGAGLGLKVTKDEVEVSSKLEVAEGTELTASISNKKVTAALTRKWELKQKQKKFPFAAGPVPCYVKLLLKGELALGADGEADFEKGISKIGVKAEGKMEGSVELGLNGGIVELGGRLTLIPSLKAHGYLCYDSIKDKYYPDLSGLDGNINAKGTILLSAADEITSVLEKVGISKDTLTFTIMESDEYNLLKVTSPGYDENGLKGSWNISEGEDIIKIKKKIKDAYEYVMEKYESIKNSVYNAVFDFELSRAYISVDSTSKRYGDAITVTTSIHIKDDDWVFDDDWSLDVYSELYYKGKKVTGTRGTFVCTGENEDKGDKCNLTLKIPSDPKKVIGTKMELDYQDSWTIKSYIMKDGKLVKEVSKKMYSIHPKV